MRAANTNIIDFRVGFLLCTLFTLSPNEDVFKKINLKIIWGMLASINNLSEFKKILGTTGIRHFAYRLIKPCIKKKSTLSKDFVGRKNKLYNETILLKKYFTKFRHNYRYHYCLEIDMYNKMPTKKELNTIAFKSLMLLSGI